VRERKIAPSDDGWPPYCNATNSDVHLLQCGRRAGYSYPLLVSSGIPEDFSHLHPEFDRILTEKSHSLWRGKARN
jgi:hypothetical protein